MSPGLCLTGMAAGDRRGIGGGAQAPAGAAAGVLAAAGVEAGGPLGHVCIVFA